MRGIELLAARSDVDAARISAVVRSERFAGGAVIQSQTPDTSVRKDRVGGLTGRIDPEQVLGRIFATFCIGK